MRHNDVITKMMVCFRMIKYNNKGQNNEGFSTRGVLIIGVFSLKIGSLSQLKFTIIG